MMYTMWSWNASYYFKCTVRKTTPILQWVSGGTKKHFPAETMSLVIGQTNQNGCYGETR